MPAGREACQFTKNSNRHSSRASRREHATVARNEAVPLSHAMRNTYSSSAGREITTGRGDSVGAAAGTPQPRSKQQIASWWMVLQATNSFPSLSACAISSALIATVFGTCTRSSRRRSFILAVSALALLLAAAVRLLRHRLRQINRRGAATRGPRLGLRLVNIVATGRHGGLEHAAD